MNHATPGDDTLRLNKRLAEVVPCSRNEAELYIAGGWVAVDGVVVEEPGARVMPSQRVELLPGARAEAIAPVTIVLHKEAGVEASQRLIVPEHQQGSTRFLRRHLANLKLVAPLEAKASGLVVFTQDFRVERKLGQEDVEHEIIAQVSGRIAEGGLAQLNQGMKASWQNETRLRFATKILKPGLVERLCREVGLEVVALKRIRLGRLPMATLAPGQWRYLSEFERF